ncbi:hypothetical protein [Nocardiopsis baichengensis]|uniref:hypothetical protein n=1 Tax=Nocardiopsis baichengensis TaxID=280240 RepID=UPI001EFA066D|nr:hypothetical protein [Nocardiopsis baichengensis]
MSYPPSTGSSGQGGRSYPAPPPPPGSAPPKGTSGGSGGNKALVVAVVFLGFAVLVAAAVVFVVAGRGADEGSASQDAGAGAQGGGDGAGGAGGAGGAEDAAAGEGEAEGSAEEPQEDTVVFGPDEELSIEVVSPQTYVDLDGDPPLVVEDRVDGYDFVLRPNINGVAFENSGGGIAPLPEGGEAPDRAACLDAVETNGSTGTGFSNGSRFCVQTDQGRVAYIEAVSSPGGTGTATVQATVWE